MSFLELAQARFACRNFEKSSISEEEINYILEAARMAPSACNNQPSRILIVKDGIEQLAQYTSLSSVWFKEAPLVFAICVDYQKGWINKDGKSTGDIDAAIVIDHMTLAAQDIGIGSCWVKGFDQTGCKELLKVPDNYEIVALLPVGHPAQQEKMEKKRIEIDKLLQF